jgi:alpha-amylase/alpha-mannosidase (GH57 family)
MPVLRVVILWHQHQPFYKDLATGEYRLPWVRMHALKDYYGMVKLLDEFPRIHQTFNLVPSLMTQVQEYAAGTARDPFLSVAAKPASDLTPEERNFALRYLFQANQINAIGRYPRYKELSERYAGLGAAPERAETYFELQDYTDLQVLSQIAWFDEFFLEDPETAALVAKGSNYSIEDQQFVIAQERKLIAKALPAHAEAAKQGRIEISTSPFYHPILPLICDTDIGAVSSPGLPLPRNRFQQPEDAAQQIRRGMDLHEQVFGIRPRGLWPSEGSISEEAISIAHRQGIKWMASDEGVLERTLDMRFGRDESGRLFPAAGDQLYTVHHYAKHDTEMHLIFRDHTISDLIGFVYSGMPAPDAANHLLYSIKNAAEPVLAQGRDAVVSIILDGENAWEYFPRSGREFLRRFYDGLQREPGVEVVTVSEAIARQKDHAQLTSFVPGSWINANFNVWIGAPEDNRSWDYLYHARQFYEQAQSRCTEAQRKLALEELLIAEGSDWNWWYGPEHHSANDADFDQLYRKHLSNVYVALGAIPPDYLAYPIQGEIELPSFTPQQAYIHPEITGDTSRYFEWMGAAVCRADRRAGAMHGKVFALDSAYAGIDGTNVYGRLDFLEKVTDCEVLVNVEADAEDASARRVLRLDATVEGGRIQSWSLSPEGEQKPLAASSHLQGELNLALDRSFEFKMPLTWLFADPVFRSPAEATTALRKLRLRFTLWRDRLPVDALPGDGWMELPLLSDEDMRSRSHWHSG